MPTRVTAPVTARDSLVVAFDEAELRSRLERFRDLSLPDDDIRRQFFPRARSDKYPAGDTRGWKLAAARRRLAADPQWDRHIRHCLYRPFDVRAIYYDATMIDWPRPALMRYLLDQNNVALIARRQTVPGEPSGYFWATRVIALDGIIRSDNRGSESLFPLFLEASDESADCQRQPTVNVSPEFIARLSRLGYPAASVGPAARDAFHYIYALFHAPSYRKRFAEELCLDYPRVPTPAQPRLLEQMMSLGQQLLHWHLGDAATVDIPLKVHSDGASAQPTIKAQYPQYDQERVLLNRNSWIENIPAEAWVFRVGSHQICRKWLRDRRGRTLTAADLMHYRYILSAVSATLELMNQIDAAIEACGDWPVAFC